SMLTGSMDKTFYSQKGAVFRVVYTSFDVTKYTKVMNVKVPTQFRLNNLQIWATTPNITKKETVLIQTKLPFSIIASPFTLVLRGKNKTVTFKADEATLTPINTLSLKGGVRLIANKTVTIGESAYLALEDDKLILTFENGKIAFKF
ncbi:MAG: hypothetical protein J6B07_08555, partial [Opitutales bacterium]|nr:hypothetical protein [Opitutales bacterium]